MPKRIPSLDGLRAISILLVILGHLGGTRHFPPGLGPLTHLADFGVRVFFVISGYLITHLLLKEHAKYGSISLGEFYRRRAFRILPPAYLYMTVVVVAEWHSFTRQNVLAAYAYVSNYFVGSTPWPLGHLWSLSVEEQFYLLWPLALALAFSLRKKIALWAILTAPVLRIAFYLAGWNDIAHYFPTVADAIAAGCLLAIVWPALQRFDRFLLSPAMIATPLLAAGIALLPEVGGPGLPTRIYFVTGQTIMHFAIAVCIYNAIRKQWRWLNVAPMIWVGVVSYSLYLWQQPFVNRNDQLHWWTAFPQNVLLALLLAATSYYLVEQPFLRLRDWHPGRNRVRGQLAPILDADGIDERQAGMLGEESASLLDRSA